MSGKVVLPVERQAKFPKGVKMTVDEVAAVVGPEFKEMNENPPDSVIAVREKMQGKSAAFGTIEFEVTLGGQQGDYTVYNRATGALSVRTRGEADAVRKVGDVLKDAVERVVRLQIAGMFGPELVSVEADPPPSKFIRDVLFNADQWRGTRVYYDTKTDKWSMRQGRVGGYRPYRSYRDDPRWIRARRPGVADDGTPVKRGDKILWWPRTKTIMVGRRAQDAWEKFESEAADEAMMSGRYAVHRERISWEEPSITHTAARAPGGLYGFTKRTQLDCEACTRKVARKALSIAKAAFRKDEMVVPFLKTHAKRGKSRSARVLLAAMKEIGPKIASEMYGGKIKEAGVPEYSMYGFRAKTVRIGLAACADIKTCAGRVASDLHRRRADRYDKITGFLAAHAKQSRCQYSRMILSCYPDPEMKLASYEPHGVEEWLRWADDDLESDKFS